MFNCQGQASSRTTFDEGGPEPSRLLLAGKELAAWPGPRGRGEVREGRRQSGLGPGCTQPRAP